MVLGTSDGNHMRTLGHGHLERETAHPSCGTVEQHPLSPGKGEATDDRFIGRSRRKWQRSSLHRCHTRSHASRLCAFLCREVGEGVWQASWLLCSLVTVFSFAFSSASLSTTVPFDKDVQACTVISFLIRGGRNNHARTNISMPGRLPRGSDPREYRGQMKSRHLVWPLPGSPFPKSSCVPLDFFSVYHHALLLSRYTLFSF